MVLGLRESLHGERRWTHVGLREGGRSRGQKAGEGGGMFFLVVQIRGDLGVGRGVGVGSGTGCGRRS